VKNSVIGERVQMHHFSYMGDATVGADTNVGAGTITMNYDGMRKHRTTIGERVFLGCDTLLRAPVHIGDGATTGGGAIVTRDVPAGMLVVGAPARVARRVLMAGLGPSQATDAQNDAQNDEPNDRPAEQPSAAGPDTSERKQER
jgi:bifunctional UDP-N-acetylglucosamine pyrophosphorylase/glucosamine-1-phosphate N-acetyltransferase